MFGMRWHECAVSKGRYSDRFQLVRAKNQFDSLFCVRLCALGRGVRQLPQQRPHKQRCSGRQTRAEINESTRNKTPHTQSFLERSKVKVQGKHRGYRQGRGCAKVASEKTLRDVGHTRRDARRTLGRARIKRSMISTCLERMMNLFQKTNKM